MKKLFTIAALSIAFASCQKEDDGFMYKATHEFYIERTGQIGYTSDYFKMPVKDSVAAWNYYTQTRAYHDISTWTDTTYIEYHCTWEEWKESGEEGMKIN